MENIEKLIVNTLLYIIGRGCFLIDIISLVGNLTQVVMLNEFEL